MNLKVNSVQYIFLVLFFTQNILYLQAQSNIGRVTYNGSEDFNFENYYLGNVTQTIDVDERSDFYEGYMILRKNDQYAIMNSMGNLVIPYGKYLFNIGEYNKLKKDVLMPNTLVVRSPETGLYGMIETKEGQEIVPCIYNELTPLYIESQNAIGTITDINKNLKTKYSVNSKGEQRIIPKDVYLYNNRRYIPYYDNTRTGNEFYDILTGEIIYTKYSNIEPIGSDLFLVKENFNGLRKNGFINTKGEIVIPFQNAESISSVLPFQSSYNLNGEIVEVSILWGKGDHYFNFALMDKSGNIFSKLKNGNGFSGLSFKDERKIISGKILMNGKRDKDSKYGEFFWYVTEGEELVKIEEMYFYNFQYFAVLPKDIPTFQYQSRNGRVVIFNSRALFTEQKNLLNIFPEAQPQWVSGGINSGVPSKRKQEYVVEGVGVLNENGLLEVPPVFSKINNPDYQSGLAYAEMKYKGKIYKGYIETEGEQAGTFRFFIK